MTLLLLPLLYLLLLFVDFIGITIGLLNSIIILDTCVQGLLCTYKHVDTCTHTHTHTHIHTPILTSTHTHKYMHTQIGTVGLTMHMNVVFVHEIYTYNISLMFVKLLAFI